MNKHQYRGSGGQETCRSSNINQSHLDAAAMLPDINYLQAFAISWRFEITS
jgi:hypothetical protein